MEQNDEKENGVEGISGGSLSVDEGVSSDPIKRKKGWQGAGPGRGHKSEVKEPDKRLTREQISHRIQELAPSVIKTLDKIIQGKPLKTLPKQSEKYFRFIKLWKEWISEFPVDNAGGFSEMNDNDLREYIYKIAKEITDGDKPEPERESISTPQA